MDYTIDLGTMFPDYDSALARREGDMAIVRLYRNGSWQPITVRISIEHMYQSLELLRKVRQ
jgi:hypothetical protein